MKALDLFSGIGGFAIACRRVGIETVGYCEIEPFAVEVLKENIRKGRLDDAPIHGDIAKLDGTAFRGVDLVCGGFPCQQISAAGKGEGLGTEEAPTERSGLWWEMRRIIGEARPAWVLVENVPALRTRGGDEVLASLEALGYTCWPVVVGAWAVGAPHKRDRAWIVGRLGDAVGGDSGGGTDLAQRSAEERAASEGSGNSLGGSVAQPSGEGRGEQGTPEWLRALGAGCDCGGARWPARPGQPQYHWEKPRLVEFSLGKFTHGIPTRLVRAANRGALKAYGNAIVPQVAEEILRVITGLHYTWANTLGVRSSTQPTATKTATVPAASTTPTADGASGQPRTASSTKSETASFTAGLFD